MAIAQTPEQLAVQIETLVAAYVDEAERIARAAFNRGFAVAQNRSSQTSAGSTPKAEARSKPRQQGPRRTRQQLNDLAERLSKAIADEPGGPMSSFAQKLDISARELHRPMTMLRDEGRIRSVGQRTHARYFPMPSGG